ncbi:hypothetical protein PMAYCL1PPCAC_27674, partial [Pristionchus mayeri]
SERFWRRRNSKTLWKPAARMSYFQMFSFCFFFSSTSSAIFLVSFCDLEVFLVRSSDTGSSAFSHESSTLFSTLDIDANFS